MPSPTDLPNLFAWYKADAGLFDATSGGSAVASDGAAVLRWEDQSGNGRHLTQGSTGDCPLFDATKGLVVDPYDGTNRYMLAPAGFTLDRQNYSCFVVAENSTCILQPYLGSFRWFWGTNDSFGQFDLMQSDNGSAGGRYLAAYDGVSSPYGTSSVQLTQVRSLFGWVGDGTNTRGWVDGDSTTGPPLPSGTRTIAEILGHSGDSWQGSYRDVIIYSSAVAQADVLATILPYALSRGVSSRRAGQLVPLGDSITAGYGASLNRGYVSRLSLPDTVRRRNVSLAGRQVSAMDSGFAHDVTPLAVGGEVNVVLAFGGTNDVAAGASGATAYASLDSIRTKAQAAGMLCVAVTMLPRSGFSGTAQETARTDFNALIHTNAASFDGVVSLDADSRTEASYLSTYTADGIHPNDSGAAVIASLVDPVVSPLFPSSGTADGSSTATAVGVGSSPGTAAGAASATAVGVGAAAGSASGASTASGVSTGASVGSATGATTATAVGVGSAAGSASGTSTAAAVPGVSSVGTASGTASATAVGTGSATGTAAGTSTASGVAASTPAPGMWGMFSSPQGGLYAPAGGSSSVGSAAGSSTAVAVGVGSAVGSAAGTSTATAVNGRANTGTADGSSTATAVGVGSATATAAGSSTASAAAVGSAAGTANGTSTAAAVSAAAFTGTASGSSTATAVAVGWAAGTAAGSSTAVAVGPLTGPLVGGPWDSAVLAVTAFSAGPWDSAEAV